jgi:hypothetical protein
MNALKVMAHRPEYQRIRGGALIRVPIRRPLCFYRIACMQSLLPLLVPLRFYQCLSWSCSPLLVPLSYRNLPPCKGERYTRVNYFMPSSIKAEICAFASSAPWQRIQVWPHSLVRYSCQSRCSGDSFPPFDRFISIQKRKNGTNRSGTPGLTPSAFSLPAVARDRNPPFGMAKMRTGR